MRTNVKGGAGVRPSFLVGAFAMTALVGLTPAMPVFAQDVDEDSRTVVTVPETVVSASRVELPAERVGSAVTVITAEDLERSGQTYVSDVLRDVPGVAVNRSGSPGSFTQVRIRGAEGNHTLVIIDGIEVNNLSAGSEYDMSALLTSEIERIEVLRGAQSALFGSDAIGGVISITTKRGRDGFSGTAQLEGGSFKTRQATAAVRYGADRFNIAGSVTRFRSEGVSNAADETQSEADGNRNDTGSINFAIDPVDWLGVDGVVRATRTYVETDPQTNGVVVDGARDTQGYQRYGLLGLTLDPLDGAWTHRFDVSYAQDENDFRTNGGVTFLRNGAKRKYAYQTTVSFDTPSVAGAEHKITFLAENERDQAVTNFQRQGSIVVETDSYALEYNLALFESLFLSASFREDLSDLFQDQGTHRFTAAYLVDGWGTRFHTSHGTGVKNPTINQLFGGGNTFVANPNLTPEYSESYDFGIEQRFWGDRAVVDVTYFINDVEDRITGTGNTVRNLVGLAEAEGVEVAGDVAITDQLDIGASYTWTLAQDANGREQLRRPKHLASLNVNYRFLEDRANLNLGVDFNGSFLDNEFIATTPQTTNEMGSFTLVNLNGSYEVVDGLQVYARGENLLDEQYEEVFTFGTPGIAGYAGVRWNF